MCILNFRFKAFDLKKLLKEWLGFWVRPPLARSMGSVFHFNHPINVQIAGRGRQQLSGLFTPLFISPPPPPLLSVAEDEKRSLLAELPPKIRKLTLIILVKIDFKHWCNHFVGWMDGWMDGRMSVYPPLLLPLALSGALVCFRYQCSLAAR